MQTFLPEQFTNTAEGKEADRILRKCVHCGFCSATCPTYQLLGDELDGPRGRIYLIKNLLEGNEATEETQLHLDRCLTCRACETTCPSGVEYGHLLDIGRQKIEEEIPRSFKDRSFRKLLGKIIPDQKLFSFFLKTGQFFKPLLLENLAQLVPEKQTEKNWPANHHKRTMLVLDGCVQPSLSPATNLSAANVLDALGISLIREQQAGCCGAMNQHLAQVDQAEKMMRNNIDAWWPHVEADIEAIVITASGCGTMIKDYGYLLRDDPKYADKAKRISDLTKDLVEVIGQEDLSMLKLPNRFPEQKREKIAYQSPCSLQHGQKLSGAVEKLLQDLGCDLTPVNDSHLCCGSAGAYSLLQPKIAEQLRENKLDNLTVGKPDLILTANIGCQHFLGQKSAVPVKHWVEWLADISH
jgi:glycolate oxidase iron-sulfur subunit